MVATLTGISLVSPEVGWIIGRDGYYNGMGAFLLQYQHGEWRLEAFPALVDAKLTTPTSIAMVTADTGWIAATLAPDSTPVILHERAGAWTVERLPAGAGAVSALAAPTADDAWALATSFDLASGLPTSAILHDHDGQWTAEATYSGAFLHALSMDSAQDGWAAGTLGTHPLLLHYAHDAWTRSAPSALSDLSALTGVFMASPSVGWATGVAPPDAVVCTDCGGAMPQRVALRFRDGEWQQVREVDGGTDDLPYTPPSSEQILPDSVAAGADGSGWLAREQLVYFAPDGRQQVFSATCKTDFLGMALVPASTGVAPEGWVIGSHGQLFHLASGTLTRYDTGAPCDPFA